MRIPAAGLLAVGLVITAWTDTGTDMTRVSGTLAPPDLAVGAYTYNPAAPAGARLTVEVSEPHTAGTRFELDVAGLLPDRGYAVHAHTNPCGRTGDAAGPHYQHRQDPAATPDTPSVDPAYANPHNEIWLDLRTGANGSGSSRTTVPFRFTDRAPASIVLHEHPTTSTAPGHAGTAGERIACLTIDLRQAAAATTAAHRCRVGTFGWCPPEPTASLRD